MEEYVEEVARSISFVRQAPQSLISLEEKQDFFRSSAKNLGASALCLSGGASFGYYHFGVVRALLDTGLLPRVVTGTSAGAIGESSESQRTEKRLTSFLVLVAALTCTRTDEELRQMLVPELADRITACSEPFSVRPLSRLFPLCSTILIPSDLSSQVWAKRVWRTGARFDTVEWARKASFFTLGSMTFKEAFERTGRILNVSGRSFLVALRRE